HWIGWFTKWLVSLIAGAIDKNVVNQQVLVLAGGQGIGKTTWLNHIVPKKLDKYSSTGYLNPDSKDALIQASECILVNIDELSSLNNKNLEAFKQLVTQIKIRVRKPYGFNPENLVKRASFCGSTNEEQFLIDATGNRRFLCFKVGDIDLDRLANFNIDNVFSQAYAMYKNGFKYWFDKEENKLIEINNSNYILRTLEEEAIMNEFCPCSKEEEGINIFKWTASEVMLFLSNSGLITNNAASAQRVGKALIKLGYIRFKSNGRMFYKIKKK
ncbi:MAG: virulence-associated E family protein, partial [Flavobacteriales bacterium]|nr:virulence-associated E family protein [Flavobacteriales bacterium]